MIKYYKEEIEVFEHNISKRLERIGFCVSELLSSENAKFDYRLYKLLTAILSATFKTYASTQKLEYYFESSIIKLSDVYYSDFKGYKTGMFIIMSFCGKLSQFELENSDYNEIYSILKNEIEFLNNDFKVMQREYKRYMGDKKLLQTKE